MRYSTFQKNRIFICLFSLLVFMNACKKQQLGDASDEQLTTSYNDSKIVSDNTSSDVARATTFPSDVLNLSNWKIALPIDDNGNQSGDAKEVKQPALDSYTISPYFRVTSTGTGVSFRANCGGATTSGSEYPRSELREMKNNGTTNASWSSGSGTHTMEIDQSIKNLPVQKPQMIVGQVFGTSDDVIT
jgi:Alginate lyase